jgi:D-glycero-D-manno-heptose 1,7-bisphosphate phosphatase
MGVDTLGRRAVFLDRDGVLNRAFVRDGKPFPPSSIDELEILPGVPEALGRLKRAGFILIVVTNQPDVARGQTSRDAIERIHARLRAKLPLDEIRVCYHDDRDECECRKPKPGLLMNAAHDLKIEMKASYMVGDRWRDIEAGRRAGCRPLLVDHGYEEDRRVQPDARVGSLAEAADWILDQERIEGV